MLIGRHDHQVRNSRSLALPVQRCQSPPSHGHGKDQGLAKCESCEVRLIATRHDVAKTKASPALLAKVSITSIESIFSDEKIAKQILAAAKRVSKKRPADGSAPAPSKRQKADPNDSTSPAEIERSLILPISDADEAAMCAMSVCTNRAPLVLAFAVIVLQYTMPNQPLSSRLSLAQALVSANSRTKAINIGLEKGPNAEDEGYGQGQPSVHVMGREIRVLRRWGYDPKEGDVVATKTESSKSEDSQTQAQEDLGSPSTIKQESSTAANAEDPEPALWGLDLEALRKSNSSAASPARMNKSSSGMPIHNATPARAYLLRSFLTPESEEVTKKPDKDHKPEKKKTTAQLTAEKERNAAHVLRAIDLLCQSWAGVLRADELDRRSWSWYVHVRPEVQDGISGWGGKGVVKLEEILKLRRTA